MPCAASRLQCRPMSRDAHVLRELFEVASLGAPENAVGFLFWRVLHRYVREIDLALATLDLTHLQFETLIQAAWLGRSSEQVTQSEIARFGDIHPMQISHMLKTLEEKGLVARVPSRSDKRVKCVKITAPGLSALRRGLPVVIDVQRRFFGEEGRVGGSFLTALLRLDRESGDEAKPASVE